MLAWVSSAAARRRGLQWWESG